MENMNESTNDDENSKIPDDRLTFVAYPEHDHNARLTQTASPQPNTHDDRQTISTSATVDDRLTSFVRPHYIPDDRQTTAIVSPPPVADTPSSADHISPLPEAGKDGFGTRLFGIPPTQTDTSAFERYQVGKTVLNEKYLLIERLQGGTQAWAFHGRSVVSEQDFFIKIQLMPTDQQNAFAKQISVRDKIFKINHPNLLRCYDFDLDHGSLCEVYEFVHGQSLSTFLKSRAPLSDAVIECMIRQLAEAIHALHQTTELAHRDIKPDNIILASSDPLSLKVVDYGIVSRLDSGGITYVAGTRQYSPAEIYQRYIENDPQLRSWDWWSLGRIVQEAVDGIHPYFRLSQLFPEQYETAKSNESVVAAQHLFDTIMGERRVTEYKCRAGMVELSEANPRAERWLPLMRGLLTSVREKRWGYEEVVRFLAGESVPDFYTQDVIGETPDFIFKGKHWKLPQLAVMLALESGTDPQQWKEAQGLLYSGDLLRYVINTLHNLDLRLRLEQCRTIPDRDLATAIALSLVSDGQFTPSVQGRMLNRDYVFTTASSDRLDAEEHLETILSDDFIEALRYLDPNAAESIKEVATELSGLRDRLSTLQIYWSSQTSSPPKPLSMLVQLLGTLPEELIPTIENEYRPILHHTENAALEALYSSSNLNKLTPVDIRALRLSLRFASANRYVSMEAVAEQLHAEGIRLNRLHAARLLERRLSWASRLVKQRFFPTFVIASVAVTGGLLWASSQGYSDVPGTPFNFPLLGFSSLDGIILGAIFAATEVPSDNALKRDLTALLPTLPNGKPDLERIRLLARSSATNKGSAPNNNLLTEILKINTRICNLAGIDNQRYLVRPISFERSRKALAIQTILAALFIVGCAYLRNPHYDASGEPLSSCFNNRALEIRDVETDFPSEPPASFKTWIRDVAYTSRVSNSYSSHNADWYMTHHSAYYHPDWSNTSSSQRVDWFSIKAAGMDVSTVLPLGLDEREDNTADWKMKQFYHGLFTYIGIHSHSLATSSDSPYIDPAWQMVRRAEAYRYLYGIRRMVDGKNAAPYYPWTNRDWSDYLQQP